MSVGFWNLFFEWCSLVLLVLAFFFGGRAVCSLVVWMLTARGTTASCQAGNRISARQAERLVTLENELTTAKTALLAQQERVATELSLIHDALVPRRIAMSRGYENPRERIRLARFYDVVQYAGTSAIIQSVMEPEAETLAADIATALKTSGWNPMLTTEAASRIPQSLIPEGVLVITREESGPEEPVVLSRAGKAAQALITLFAVDLWHQPFGIRWSPEYDDGRSNTGDDFAFPKNAVVILVGRRPMEFLKSFIGLAKKRNECRDLVIG